MRGERFEFEIRSAHREYISVLDMRTAVLVDFLTKHCLLSENPAYIAVALSTDSKMGNDSVMECVREGGQVRAYTSWTLPPPNLGVTRENVVSELTAGNLFQTVSTIFNLDFLFFIVSHKILCDLLRRPITTACFTAKWNVTHGQEFGIMTLIWLAVAIIYWLHPEAVWVVTTSATMTLAGSQPVLPQI